MTNADDGLLNPLIYGMSPPPLLVVISGPSGVGKDSILMRMRARQVPFHFVVTATSRGIRPGERDGYDYHFVTTEQFEELIRDDELIEWAEVYGQYKGVPKYEVRQALASGKDVVLRLDVQGAATIKRLAPDAVSVFVMPGSLEELRIRLETRKTELPGEIERRLAIVREELEQIRHFDYIVINRHDQLDYAVDQIVAIVMAEQRRVRPRCVSL
ncbi:MAG TPA: guanylate kinase [Roseiflexaceae bacterium]|nr:guanylate kinase [Roseiflexaceae bacterium]